MKLVECPACSPDNPPPPCPLCHGNGEIPYNDAVRWYNDFCYYVLGEEQLESIDMRSRCDNVLFIVNKMLGSGNVKYSEFNKRIKVDDYDSFVEFEKFNPEVGLTEDGWSTLSLIATITDILCKKRLMFYIDEDHIFKAGWYGE